MYTKVCWHVTSQALAKTTMRERSRLHMVLTGGPQILGLEAAGEVVEDNSEDPRFKKGDKVMTLLDGGG